MLCPSAAATGSAVTRRPRLAFPHHVGTSLGQEEEQNSMLGAQDAGGTERGEAQMPGEVTLFVCFLPVRKKGDGIIVLWFP